MRPRIAHISPIVPAAGGNGLAMRTGMFSDAAEQTGELLIVVVGSQVNAVVPDRPIRSNTKLVRIDEGTDTRLRLIASAQPVSSRPGLLTDYGRPLTSLPLSAATVARTIEQLTGFGPDLIILSRAYLLPIVDAFDSALASVPLLVDLDDDDAGLCRSFASDHLGAGREVRALWLQAQADVYDAVISAHANAAALFTAASPHVARSIGRRLGIANITCVLNGISCADISSGGRPGWRGGLAWARRRGSGLLFVGNLGYRPNVDGMVWFLEEAWPALRDAAPRLGMTVAGSDPDERLAGLCQGNGVRLVANPPDLAPLYQRADAAIIPLRFGSGSRIKILEAGCHGVPVVSTFAGAEGLEIDAGRHAFLSDTTADAFSRACLECLRDADAARARAMALKGFVRDHHDRRKITSEIHAMLCNLLSA